MDTAAGRGRQNKLVVCEDDIYTKWGRGELRGENRGIGCVRGVLRAVTLTSSLSVGEGVG